MKKISCWIIIYCLVCSFSVSAQWQVITVPVSAQDIFGISFLNDTTAYVSADHDLVYTQDNFSSFSGTPWSVYLLGQPIPMIKEDLREIRFKSPTEGLLTGGFNTFNDYDILQTTNAALTWDIIFTDNSGAVIRYIAAMDFKNGIGLAAGAHGHIIRSTDDGDTWNYVNSPSQENLLEIQFTTPLAAIAVGENTLMRSFDAGVSWSADTNFNNKFLYGLAVSNSGNNVYTATEDELFYSLNAGTTFTPLTLPFNNVNCLVAQGADTVFAGTSAGIYLSKDHGLHWQQFSATQSYYVNRLVIQGNQLYALCNGGIILRNGLSSLMPEPMAGFTAAQNAICGQTTVTINNNADPSYTYSWYVNGSLQGTSNTGISFNRNLSTTDSISVVVSNGISTDTAVEVLNVHVRQDAVNSSIADQSGCYGQYFVVDVPFVPGQNYQFSLDNSGFANFNSSLVLAEINSNSTLVIKANTADDCPVYDTVMVVVSSQVVEPFQPSIPTAMIGGNWRIASVDAASDSIIYALSETGDFFKSLDAGTSWSKNNISSSVSNSNIFDFVNDTLGYIADINVKTIDGGTTFPAMIALNSNHGYAGIANFLNPDTGIIAVMPSSSNFSYWKIFKTLDGGQTFTQLHYSDSLSLWISNIQMVSDQVIYVSGGVNYWSTGPRVKKTTDGGLTWTNLAVPGTAGITAMSVISEDTLLVMGQDDYVYRTYDSGTTWETYWMGSNNCGCMGGLKMISSQTGYLYRGTGDVYKTDNGGDCWTKVCSLNDNSCSWISATPSGSDVFISGKNVYHFHTWKNLSVSIDSGYCANSPIYTHNVSGGYTDYTWKLDGTVYSYNRDTVFQFPAAGNHVITLYADSAGTGLDSVQYTITILPSIGSVGNITGPLTACTSAGLVTYHFIAGSNTQVTQYHWWTDWTNLVLSDLDADTDSSLDVIFVANQNWSAYIHLYASGTNSMGCFTSDTASFLLHLVHTTPQPPVITATLQNCYYIPEDSLSSSFPFDSIFCSLNRDPLAENYFYYGTSSPDTFGYISYFANCPGSTYITASASNSCGSSAGTIVQLNVFYVPSQVIHTPDTVVADGSDVQFYFLPYSSPDISNCGTPDIWWIPPNGSLNHTNFEYYDITGFNSADTGTYTVYRAFGCDTVFASFHVGLGSGVGLPGIPSNSFDFAANVSQEIIHAAFSMLDEPAVIKLSDMTGRNIKTLRLAAGTSDADINAEELAPGIYQLQLQSVHQRRQVKLIVE